MQSKDVFEAFIAAVKENATHYDPNIDALGYYRPKEILQSNPDTFKSDQKYDVAKGIDEIKKVVREYYRTLHSSC